MRIDIRSSIWSNENKQNKKNLNIETDHLFTVKHQKTHVNCLITAPTKHVKERRATRTYCIQTVHITNLVDEVFIRKKSKLNLIVKDDNEWHRFERNITEN